MLGKHALRVGKKNPSLYPNLVNGRLGETRFGNSLKRIRKVCMIEICAIWVALGVLARAGEKRGSTERCRSKRSRECTHHKAHSNGSKLIQPSSPHSFEYTDALHITLCNEIVPAD